MQKNFDLAFACWRTAIFVKRKVVSLNTCLNFVDSESCSLTDGICVCSLDRWLII